jgi:adenylosuccinate synthase
MRICLDYLDAKDRNVRRSVDLGKRSHKFLHELETRTELRVGLAFTGPHQDDLVYWDSVL